MDIAAINSGTNNIGLFLGYGNNSFTNQTIYPLDTYSHPYSVAVTDLNNDAILDIIVVNYAVNNLGLFLGYGNGTFAKVIPFQLEYGSQPFSVVTGDFNSDKKIDIAVANNGSDSLNIFFQTC